MSTDALFDLEVDVVANNADNVAHIFCGECSIYDDGLYRQFCGVWEPDEGSVDDNPHLLWCPMCSDVSNSHDCS